MTERATGFVPAIGSLLNACRLLKYLAYSADQESPKMRGPGSVASQILILSSGGNSLNSVKCILILCVVSNVEEKGNGFEKI